jgi:hypothetical protein
MDQCLIEECNDEATFIAKSDNKFYYSCKKHKKEVAQIVSVEHAKAEIKRSDKAAEIYYMKKDIPKFMRI